MNQPTKKIVFAKLLFPCLSKNIIVKQIFKTIMNILKCLITVLNLFFGPNICWMGRMNEWMNWVCMKCSLVYTPQSRLIFVNYPPKVNDGLHFKKLFVSEIFVATEMGMKAVISLFYSIWIKIYRTFFNFNLIKIWWVLLMTLIRTWTRNVKKDD